MTSPTLELIDIEVHYGFVRALDYVDFHADGGEIVALLGDNGAGKSTLLKVMSGALRATRGTIRVHGRDVSFHAPSDAAEAGIQMVYQDLALIEPQDVATNLQLGREPLRGFPWSLIGWVDRKKMRDTSQRELNALGVRTAPMSRPVEMLSGGQRQVIAVARSAMHVDDNGVILLDEPTAALGYEQTKLVQGLLRRMADRGIAVVLVTHDLPLCFDVADRIVVLNRGSKVADIATAETDGDAVVGWITGTKASQFADDTSSK